jgi:hypothetical protein
MFEVQLSKEENLRLECVNHAVMAIESSPRPNPVMIVDVAAALEKFVLEGKTDNA